MPPKKKKVSGKKGSKKKVAKKKGAKKPFLSGVDAAQAQTEAGTKSREFLRLQVGDLKEQVVRLRESNDKLKGDRDALFDIGSASAEQLKSEVEYYRRENLRHVDELEEEKRRWIEGTANLRQEILDVRAEVETKRSEARSREAELKAEIVALNQKLAGLEEFRDQEHAIRKQLGEVQTQLAQCEAMHNTDKDALERKLVEQQGAMAATIDEKVAEVALAFQTEADARLCDRTAGVLKENVKMERKLKDINTQVMGVVDANDRLKKKVNELKIELQIADDAQKSLGTTVRKSKKVTEALRDRLLEETSKIQQAEETLAESKVKHAQHSESQQRLIDAMQASLDATERTRTIEAHRLEDLSHMKTIEALVEWSIAELERSYFRRQKELEDVQEQHEAALYHKDQMSALDLVLLAVPKVLKKLVIKAAPRVVAPSRLKVTEVCSVGVQAGGPQFSTNSSAFWRAPAPKPRQPVYNKDASKVKARQPLYNKDARRPGGALRSENHTTSRVGGGVRSENHDTSRNSFSMSSRAPAEMRSQAQTGTQFGLDVFSLAAAVQSPQRT
eukprot:m.214911 g.214911  ORF g.214911 m.214911 type:complete len:560 (-) comp25599_c0_seq2:768-2447(-)